MENTAVWLIPLVGILMGGGGIYALLKVRPEAGQISVSAAQGAVIVQTGVIDTLRDELGRATTAANEAVQHAQEANRRADDAERRLDELEAEHGECKRRLRQLEEQLSG